MEGNQRIRNRLTCALVLLATTVVTGAGAASASAVTISPLNGTPDASPQTQISFLGVPAGQILDVSVVGSRSGRHGGELRAYASAAGASFVPTRGFTEGERVTATAVLGARGHGQRVGTTFYIARLVDYPRERRLCRRGARRHLPDGELRARAERRDDPRRQRSARLVSAGGERQLDDEPAGIELRR
jgi:hypothetical protein